MLDLRSSLASLTVLLVLVSLGCADGGRRRAAPDGGVSPTDGGGSLDDGATATDGEVSNDDGGSDGGPTACTEDTDCDPGEVCDPVEGCITPPPCTVDADCDDGMFCTGVETCDPSVGCRTTAVDCDDMIGCTLDGCDETMDACTHAPDDAMCSDSLGCNGVETCVVGTGCAPGMAMTCNDGVACTMDSCVEPGTCMNVGADADGDGFVALGCLTGNDCNDSAPAVRPGATELCDGVDNDCSSAIDDGPGMACALGSGPASCTTACSTAGTAACTPSCTRAACLAATETCGNGCDDNGNGAVDEGCAPPNDQCAGAVALSGAGSSAGTLVGATAQTTDCGSGVEVFYRVTVSTPSIVYLSTVGGATFDTRLSYRGTACAGSAAQCVDDSCSSLQTHLAQRVGAGTHYFAVHTYYSGTTPGPFTLSYRVIPTTSGTAVHVPDDDLAAPGTVQTYSGTTASSGSLAPTSCGSSFAGAAGENVYYFAQCPSDSRAYVVSTCTSTSYDSVVWARFNGSEIGCNDDSCGLQSTMTTSTASGAGVVEVFVDGYSTASGAYQMSLTL